MHEAWWNREKNDVDNRRTRASILRAAISNASNKRTLRQWARAALFEHTVAQDQARVAPVEQSALPRGIDGHLLSILRFRRRLEPHTSSISRRQGRLERPFGARSGPGPSGHFPSQRGPGWSCHFERAALLRQARPAIRLSPGRCGSWPGSMS